MRKIFIPPKLSLRSLCTVALLVAITALLAIFFTLRIGNLVKIPFKFISVFLTGVLFGPWLGGLCGALGDIFNTLFGPPSGTPLPAITVLEFVSGFVFGALFYMQKTEGRGYVLRCFVCMVIQFLIDMLLTTSVLVYAGIYPEFVSTFILRLPAGIIKAALLLVATLSGRRYLKIFLKLGGRQL